MPRERREEEREKNSEKRARRVRVGRTVSSGTQSKGGKLGGEGGRSRDRGEPTLCSCGTITTMGYRTAAIAGEMPNGLKDRAGLAVRSLRLVVAWRTGDGQERAGRREGFQAVSSLLVCLLRYGGPPVRYDELYNKLGGARAPASLLPAALYIHSCPLGT